jgi:hypothetical protein
LEDFDDVSQMDGWGWNCFYQIGNSGTIVSNGSLDAADARQYLVYERGLLRDTWVAAE